MGLQSVHWTEIKIRTGMNKRLQSLWLLSISKTVVGFPVIWSVWCVRVFEGHGAGVGPLEYFEERRYNNWIWVSREPSGAVSRRCTSTILTRWSASDLTASTSAGSWSGSSSYAAPAGYHIIQWSSLKIAHITRPVREYGLPTWRRLQIFGHYRSSD